MITPTLIPIVLHVPNGQSQIRAGDRVIVMAQELFLQDLNDILG